MTRGNKETDNLAILLIHPEKLVPVSLTKDSIVIRIVWAVFGHARKLTSFMKYTCDIHTLIKVLGPRFSDHGKPR
jgi:hypothetical protein